MSVEQSGPLRQDQPAPLPAAADAATASREPIFEPAWLRRAHRRCLWDGGRVRPGMEFCSEQCGALYDLWASLPSRRHPGEDYVRERNLTAVLPTPEEVIRYDRDSIPRGEVAG